MTGAMAWMQPFQGASGYERAERHTKLLEEHGVRHSFRQELGGAWTLRFGPLSAAEVSVALQAFGAGVASR